MAKGVPETHPEERNALNISPRKNWVEKAGGLPSYINSVAVALVRGGMPRERAIPTAVNVVKKTCATGLWGGRPKAKVSPAIRAAACKAAAEWEAKKGGAKLSACADCSKSLDLAGPVVTSKAGQPVTVNALMQGMKPRHVKALAKANRNLQRSGMSVAKRRKVLRSMAKGLKSGKVSLSHRVDLAFNPSEMRAPKGTAGGGRWSAGGPSKAQQRATGRQAAQSRTGRSVSKLDLKALASEKALEARGQRTAGKASKKQRAQLDAVRALIGAELKRQPQSLNAHQKGLLWRVEHADSMAARVQAGKDLVRTLKRNAKAARPARAARSRPPAQAKAPKAPKPSAAKVSSSKLAAKPPVRRPPASRSKIGTGVSKRTATPRRLVSTL